MQQNGDHRHPNVHHFSNHSPPRFRFASWIRLHGFDILTMAFLGVLTLLIFLFGRAPTRSFPIFNVAGDVVYPEYAYPVRPRIIETWLSALLAVVVPLFFVLLFQLRRRSVDDALTTALGLIKTVFCQVTIKWLIGGIRPNFLEVCKPNIQPGSLSGVGFANLMYNQTICTGDAKEIDEALESMPSGHAAAAWATLLFLSLYFNAQLKVMSAHNPAYWKMVLFFASLLGAFLISASLTIDHYHHWYDVAVGGIIGSCCALVAYRQTFASIFDFRFNHVLLPRATSLFHRRAFLESGREPYYTYCPSTKIFSSDMPFTREGGWRYGAAEQFVGAPGDATVLFAAQNGSGVYGQDAPRDHMTERPAEDISSHGRGARSVV